MDAMTEKSASKISPVFKYLLGFVALLIVFYAVYTSKFFGDYFLTPLIGLQTSIVSMCLNVIGETTSAHGTMLNGQGVSLNVAKGCDGMEVTFLYLTGVIMMPFPWRLKSTGLLTGLSVLLLLNMFRIAILYFSQVYWPSSFDFLHLHGGFALFTVVAILMWATWANWAIRKEKQMKDAVS